MFDHMNTKNLTAQEMEAQKRQKKRKLNDISNTSATDATITLKNNGSTEGGFKQPAPVKKTA